jgi:hypothetical protein
MPIPRILARSMLGLGLALVAYQFLVAALALRAGVHVPGTFLAAWELAVYAGPGLTVVGGVLTLAPWLLQRPTFDGSEVALVVLSVLLLVIAYTLQPAVFLTCFGTRTDGRIVALHESSRGALVPEVEYTVSGQTYRLRPTQERTRRSAEEYRVGDSLPVLYRPDKPEAAVVATFAEMWALGVAASVGTTVLLLMFLASRSERPKRPHAQVIVAYSYLIFDNRPPADRPRSG